MIDQSLTAVNQTDDALDRCFNFIYLGTGAVHELSSAASAATDRLVELGAPAAAEYRGAISIPNDVWILHMGGRSITSAWQGGAYLTGFNITAQLPLLWQRRHAIGEDWWLGDV